MDPNYPRPLPMSSHIDRKEGIGKDKRGKAANESRDRASVPSPAAQHKRQKGKQQ